MGKLEFDKMKIYLYEEEVEEMKKLLEQYGNSHFESLRIHGLGLFCYCVQNRKWKVVKLLVESGWDINETDVFGDNALIYTMGVKHVKERMEYLIQNGICIDYVEEMNEVPLFYALRQGFQEEAEVLYEAGTNVNWFNEKNEDIVDHLENMDKESTQIWIERFLQEPERFDEELLRKIKAKRLELLV